MLVLFSALSPTVRRCGKLRNLDELKEHSAFLQQLWNAGNICIPLFEEEKCVVGRAADSQAMP